MAVPVLALALCGCAGIQSTLDPKGPQAAEIAHIWWVMFGGACAVLALVMVLALRAFSARRTGTPVDANRWILSGGVALPVVTLTALLVYGVYAMASLRAAPPDDHERIEVIAHQWWWEVRYLRGDSLLASAANEIRIPAGRRVAVTLQSRDVIHSFWVPSLAGKIDVIPGRVNRITLHADEPGTVRGQCAEYCGAQHARMGLHVVALQATEHAAWLAAQAEPARLPADGQAIVGRRQFQLHCAACHLVRDSEGTAPGGPAAGPDLTHVASRAFIAGGTLENTPGNLLAFITDSQALKPGNRMPSFAHLEPERLQAMARYLEGLE